MPESLNQTMELAHEWISLYGISCVALFAFVDTFVLSALFIPGSVVLVAAGFFAAAGELSIVEVAVVSFAAAYAGNNMSYWLGRIWGAQLAQRFSRHLVRLRSIVHSEGPYLLLYYHFANSLRSGVPFVCGTLRSDLRIWYLYNTLGMALWIGVLLTVGFMAERALDGEISAGQWILNLLSFAALGVAIWRIVVALRRTRHLAPADPSS